MQSSFPDNCFFIQHFEWLGFHVIVGNIHYEGQMHHYYKALAPEETCGLEVFIDCKDVTLERSPVMSVGQRMIVPEDLF